jgi:hypothetical protein
MTSHIYPEQLGAAARTVHEALRAWVHAHGQHDIPAWDEAPEWMQASTRESILHALQPSAPDACSQHEQWLAQKVRDGWAWGPVKDAAAKTHPLIVPYASLPDWERRKDALINALSQALLGAP